MPDPLNNHHKHDCIDVLSQLSLAEGAREGSRGVEQHLNKETQPRALASIVVHIYHHRLGRHTLHSPGSEQQLLLVSTSSAGLSNDGSLLGKE